MVRSEAGKIIAPGIPLMALLSALKFSLPHTLAISFLRNPR